MPFVLAAVLAIAIVAVLWKLRDRPPARRPTSGPRPQSLAPDDDPDFLRELGRRTRDPRKDDPNV